MVVTLLAIGALEFSLLGADAAGFVDAPGGGTIFAAQQKKKPTPTPEQSGGPASIELIPRPAVVDCAAGQSSRLTVKLADDRGRKVANGTEVFFWAEGGNVSPEFVETRNGEASTQVTPFFGPGAIVHVESGDLQASINVRCGPLSCAISPPSVSPPCPTPEPPSPPECDPNSPPPLSPPPVLSPPCATPTPLPCPLSPPAVSPPCITATPTPPLSPPECDPSSPPTSVSPPCATPEPPCFTDPAGAVPCPSLRLSIDCDPGSEGIQTDCTLPSEAGTAVVDIVLENVGDTDYSWTTFDFTVDWPTDQFWLPPGADSALNNNPDVNDGALGSDWACAVISIPSREDADLTSTRTSCFFGEHTILAGQTIRIATMSLRLAAGPLDGMPLTLSSASFAFLKPDEPYVEVNCTRSSLSCGEANVSGGSSSTAPTPTPTAVSVAVPLSSSDLPSPPNERFLAIDCDLAKAGIQNSCTFSPNSSADVGVVLVNANSGDTAVDAFNFELTSANKAAFTPKQGLDGNLNANPDFNEAIFGPWSCVPPSPQADTGAAAPSGSVSFLSCYNSEFNGPAVANGQSLLLATIHFSTGASGSSALSMAEVTVGDDEGRGIVYCFPANIIDTPCLGATVNVAETGLIPIALRHIPAWFR
jgi:hypothetical protein